MFSHERKNEYGKVSDKSTGLTKTSVDVDNMIPLLSIFACLGVSDMISLNAHPWDWKVGGECTWCTPFYNLQCEFAKLSDVQGECCVLFDCLCKEIVPRACCMCDFSALLANIRCFCPRDMDYETGQVPCLFNVGGCNICLDGNLKCGFLQSIKTLRQGTWCCPFIPCVCGSLANGQICCDCITACCEYKRGEKHQVVTNTGETVDKYKGQVMLEDGATIAATEALDFVKGLANQDCMGCYHEAVVLPLNWSCTCFKTMIQRGQIFTGDVFICQQCRLGCMWPRTLCAYIGQCCWNDCRCAFPCDGMDTPCIVNVLFVNFCYKWRPTFHCTYFAPLAQFDDDYKGDKYTVCDIMCFAFKVIGKACAQGQPDAKKQDDTIPANAHAVPDNTKL